MSPRRIRLRRTRGWRKPSGAVVVARPSRWGNPFTLAEVAAAHPGSDEAERRRIAADRLRDLLEGAVDGPDYPSAAEIRVALGGRDLACWCPLDQPCHADVLLEVANRPVAGDEG